MALAYSQAYTFYHWDRAYDGNADGINDSITREWWYRMKEAFIAAGWTIMGSYSGVGSTFNDGDRDLVDGVGAGAGTDTWTVPVFPNSTQRPWMVFQCPPIMGLLQVLIGFTQPLNNNPEYIDCKTSPSGSFMVINGGGDGTTTARPTAPDQITHNTNQGGMDGSGLLTAGIHACFSLDKSQFYFMTVQEQGSPHFFAFSKPDNAPVELDDGLVWTMRFGSNYDTIGETRMDNADHYTTALWYGVISGTVRTMYLGGRGWNNVGIQAQVRIPQDRKAVVGPCELYASTLTVRGYYGTIPDIYWAPLNQFRQGFGDSVGGPILWFCGGALIVPWDSTESLPRFR
jgi:hypothetical protein